jgi:anti-sigma factor RsiW
MTEADGTSSPGACDSPRVTAYVDGALPPEARADVEAHLAGCVACREQEAFERGLREKMRALPAPELPAGLEQRVVRGLRRRRLPRAVRLLPLAAAIVLVVAWARGAAPVVAWQLTRDHLHCFGKARLPAQVWTSDPREIADWYHERGTEVPLVPASVAGLELVGGRFCPLLDRRVAHLYYEGGKRRLSLYVVPGPARFTPGFGLRVRQENVRLVRTGGVTVALVSEDGDVVDAFHRALAVSVADTRPGAPPLP